MRFDILLDYLALRFNVVFQINRLLTFRSNNHVHNESSFWVKSCCSGVTLTIIIIGLVIPIAIAALIITIMAIVIIIVLIKAMPIVRSQS